MLENYRPARGWDLAVAGQYSIAAELALLLGLFDELGKSSLHFVCKLVSASSSIAISIPNRIKILRLLLVQPCD